MVCCGHTFQTTHRNNDKTNAYNFENQVLNHSATSVTVIVPMRGPRKSCQSGSNVDNSFFSFVYERKGGSKYNYKRVIIGPPAKRHLRAFRWRADDGPIFYAGLVAL